MQFTKRRVEALEILARLHSEGLAWARVIDMLPEEKKHDLYRQDSLRKVLSRLTAQAIVEREIHQERNTWCFYRLTPRGYKALEDSRTRTARPSTKKVPRHKEPTQPTLTPGHALVLMQLVLTDDAGLRLAGVAGFGSTAAAQTQLYRLTRLGLCEKITAKPPHAYRATDAGREALAEYRRYARTA